MDYRVTLRVLLAAFSIVVAEAANYSVLVPAAAVRGTNFQFPIFTDGVAVGTTLNVNVIDPFGTILVSQRNIAIDTGGLANVIFKIERSWSPGIYNVSLKSSDDSINAVSVFEVITKSESVFVITDKAIYMPSEKVNFRVLIVRPDLHPDAGEVNVTVVDPDGHAIMMWSDEPLNEGVASFSLLLADAPVFGQWAIIVTLSSRFEYTHIFSVIAVNKQRFVATLDLPAYVSSTSNSITGALSALYTDGEDVDCSVSLEVSLQNVILRKQVNITGRRSLTLTSADLGVLRLNESQYFVMTVLANFTERLTGVVVRASRIVYVQASEVIVYFFAATSDVFKPGQVYRAYVKLVYWDDKPLNETGNILSLVAYSSLYLPATPMNVINSSAPANSTTTLPLMLIANLSIPIPDDGLVTAEFRIPENVLFFSINASVNYHGQVVTAIWDAAKFVARSSNSIQLTIHGNATALKSGDSIKLGLSSLQPVPFFCVTAVSRERIVSSVSVPGSRDSVDVMLLPDHSPEVTFIVHAFDRGEILADSVIVRVSGALQGKVEFAFQDLDGRNITTAKPGDVVALRIRSTPGSLVGVVAVDQMRLLATYELQLGKVLGELDDFAQLGDDEFAYFYQYTFPRWGDGASSGKIFQNAKLNVFTNARISRRQSADIPDGAQSLVSNPNPLSSGDSIGIRNLLSNTLIWSLVYVGSSGEATIQQQLPDKSTTWAVGGFSISSGNGFTVNTEVPTVKVSQNLTIQIFLPSSCVLGEELNARILLFNPRDVAQEAVVTLHRSDMFATRLLNGTTTFNEVTALKALVPAGKFAAVEFLIIPQRAGILNAEVTVVSAVDLYRAQATSLVKHRGFPMQYCDADFAEFDEQVRYNHTFTFQYPRDVVSGSRRIILGASGNLLGPSIPRLSNLLQLPSGCGEQALVKFAPALYVLDYLDSTNRLTDELQTKLDQIILFGYQRELNYWKNDWTFSFFGSASFDGSTWLTAFVLKSLRLAQRFRTDAIDLRFIPNLENVLATRINSDGSFTEISTELYGRFQGTLASSEALTAFVLIAFVEENEAALTKLEWINGTISYLENSLSSVANDPYKLSIVSYALCLVKSKAAEYALALLQTHVIEEDGALYLTTNYQNRGFRCSYCPRPEGSTEIEMNSYALLAFIKSARLPQAYGSARWLASRRSIAGGFTSSQDTVLALQALAAYAQHVSQLQGSFSATFIADNYDILPNIVVTDADSLQFQTLSIPNPESLNTVTAQMEGQGSILTSACTLFNVLTVPTLSDIHVKVKVSPTSSEFMTATVEVCVARLLQNETTGDMGILVVSLPTGFEADLRATTSDSARFIDYEGSAVVMYFDKFNSTWSCGTVVMQQTLRVNSTADAYIVAAPYYDYDKRKVVAYNPTSGTVTDVSYRSPRSGSKCIGKRK